ncbi:MAG: hypothetical protein EZS28_030889 [Streblomastix strix]|uniref:Uncharacterized protein n=1 Tax=Streblomastix strix TaxID=222440 RepID=A0A5J4UTL0_9EUKA|nr:MAG: hypothetical protein EZS28_030889 [Streblomastix strix]
MEQEFQIRLLRLQKKGLLHQSISIVQLISIANNIGTHLSQENDQQTLALRSGSIKCLQHIHCSSDASAHSELANANYSGVLVIAISTACGHVEEYDKEIRNRLFRISQFLKYLIKGNQYSFPPQPLLARRSDEQIEEEGGNEEIDSQLINKGKGSFWSIKNNANGAKRAILNYFIKQSNQRPICYNW